MAALSRKDRCCLLARSTDYGIAKSVHSSRRGYRWAGHSGCAHASASVGAGADNGDRHPIGRTKCQPLRRPSSTSAEHVAGDLGDDIDAVLDGGISDVGLESTVIGIGEDHIVIFRPGAVTREMIQSVSGSRVTIEYAEQSVAPPSPGMKYAHYSPEAKVYLVMSAGSAAAKLAELADELALKGEKVGVLAHDDTLAGISSGLTQLSLGPREDLRFAAHMLYAQLRLADHAGLTVLLVEAVDDRGVGMALINRLRKAACKIIEE
jgi:L-threonylcarbamoyladenylate synthase